MHRRMCDALNDLRKDPYSDDCKASMKTRCVELESVLVDVKSCCHLKDAEIAYLVRFLLFESLRSVAPLKEEASRTETEANTTAKIQRCMAAVI